MSNRLSLLKTDIQQALSSMAGGSPCFRREREKVLFSLPDDLMALNSLVPRLKEIRTPVLKKLVQLWQSRGNTSNTVCRKISILRSVIVAYVDSIPFPDNPTLGIQYEKAVIAVAKQGMNIQSIRDTDVQLVCRLQVCFGLKKQEAIRFEPFMLADTELRLSREAAYNSHNRTVPYWNEAQQALIHDLKSLPITGFRASYGGNLMLLSSLHTNAFKQQGVQQKEYFRHIYLHERYVSLSQSSAKTTQLAVLKQLREEMGYADNRKIKEILTCQGVF
ncbi:MAG: hypothetical protein HKM04_09240 [Legionellales bacterium]|nr:hypothetical protein [Legionellales bacterium]